MASKGRYYRVSPQFWLDHPWDDDTRLAALYVLTSPHRTTEGIFRMPIEYARHDLGWPAKRFDKAFRRLIADGFVEYDAKASVCLITNALKWQTPENPNQVKAAVKAIGELPPTPLLNLFLTLATTHAKRLAEGLTERFGTGLANLHTPSPTPLLKPSSTSEPSGRASVELGGGVGVL